jgi:hypothetical protein
MTAIMFVLAFLIRTPIIMWLVAMSMDTIMIVTYMFLKFGKL